MDTVKLSYGYVIFGKMRRGEFVPFDHVRVYRGFLSSLDRRSTWIVYSVREGLFLEVGQKYTEELDNWTWSNRLTHLGLITLDGLAVADNILLEV